jgi:hypothetical protein
VASAELDHIVIAVANLNQGEKYITTKLGVRPSRGGRHPKQGTHNSLLKLGKDKYLEIITVDPEGNEPGHPRWFNLDDPALQKQIAERPKIIAWVVRTYDLTDSLEQASYYPGRPQSASRGALKWTFTFTEDGSLIQGGLLPHLIEWGNTEHPSSQLPESRVDIKQIKGLHPEPSLIQKHLKSLELQNKILLKKSESKVGLQVTFNCPLGNVTLSGIQEI